MRGTFRNFRQLTRLGPSRCTPITTESVRLLSDKRLIVQRWKEYFHKLLNRPVVQPLPELAVAAQNVTSDGSIETAPPTLEEVATAIRS